MNQIFHVEGQTAAMKIRFRGVRGSTPSPGPATARYGGNTSCVEIRAGSEILILDAGTGIRSLGADLSRECGERPIEATLLISHAHWDHIQGLPFFLPAFAPLNSIRIMAARNWAATLKSALRNQMKPIHFPLTFEEMQAVHEVEELDFGTSRLGAFTVRVSDLNHPGGCAGFRIEANGASLAYLPDHEPFYTRTSARPNRATRSAADALVEFVRDVDLLILDAQYTAAEYPQRMGWGHGCLPDTVALAVAARAKQLALFHHDPAHDDDQVDAMVEDAREMAGGANINIRAASENEVITLPRSCRRDGHRLSIAMGKPADCVA